MNANKITWVHVALIGGVVGLIVGVAMFFVMLKPINQKNKSLKADILTLDNYKAKVDLGSFDITQIPQAKVALAAAETRKDSETAELAALERRFQLAKKDQVVIPAGDAAQKLMGLGSWLRLPGVVIPLMENYAKAAGKKVNVATTTTFAVKAPTSDPGSIPNQIIAWDLGPMTASGRFDLVMRWVKAWNHSPLLTSVNGLQLTLAGREGKVTANCDLVVYIFPTGTGVGQAAGAAGGAPAAGGAASNMPARGGGAASNMPARGGGAASNMPARGGGAASNMPARGGGAASNMPGRGGGA